VHGGVRGRVGADGEHQLAWEIVGVDGVERDEEGANADAVVTPGVAHRGAPGGGRGIEMGEESARHARPPEFGDVMDHR
jgi:hypothetical protein